MPHSFRRWHDLTEWECLHIIGLETLSKLLKNNKMLRLQDIAWLDELPKIWAIYSRGTPLRWYALLAIWNLDSVRSKESLWGGPSKNWMLPRYAGVLHTLWREKGRTFPSANAPKGLDYSSSLDEGQVVCKVLNMFRALFYFIRRCVHQKMLYLFLSLCWTHTTERSQGPKCFRTLW